jgi:hypothetical protein
MVIFYPVLKGAFFSTHQEWAAGSSQSLSRKKSRAHLHAIMMHGALRRTGEKGHAPDAHDVGAVLLRETQFSDFSSASTWDQFLHHHVRTQEEADLNGRQKVRPPLLASSMCVTGEWGPVGLVKVRIKAVRVHGLKKKALSHGRMLRRSNLSLLDSTLPDCMVTFPELHTSY